MGDKTSNDGRTAKRARKNPITIIVIALVVILAIYTGVVGGVDKLPSWLQPIASAIVGNGGDKALESKPQDTAPTQAPAPATKQNESAPIPASPQPQVAKEKPAPAQREQVAPKQKVKEETRPIPAGSYHAKGRVIKLLADDDDGIRHQKFLIRLADGSTLLVVHNIDLAPRLDDLAPGDDVEVCGEFVENDRGGLVHWTHHVPPRSRHSAGWIKHLGKIYE